MVVWQASPLQEPKVQHSGDEAMRLVPVPEPNKSNSSPPILFHKH